MGSNTEGQLGIGDHTIKTKQAPVLIEPIVAFRPRKISAGAYHSACIMQNGELYTWGRGIEGALGIAENSTKYEPHRVNYNEVLLPIIAQVSAGADHTLSLDENGRVYAFGNNSKYDFA